MLQFADKPRPKVKMITHTEGNSSYMFMMVVVTTFSMILFQTASAQVPEHCGYSQENACAVPSEEDAQKILAVFPNAIVIVDEELYESIPEDDRKNADEIIESGARDEGASQGEDTVNGESMSPPTSGANIMELAAIDHDGDGRTCLDQHRMADEANRQLEGLGMAPLGSGNIEEDLRACLEAELTPDADDVRRRQGLGPNAGPLPDNLANPPQPRLPPNIAGPIEPSFPN